MPSIYQTECKILVYSSSSESSFLSSIGLSKSSSNIDVESYLELSIIEPVLEKVIKGAELTKDSGELMTPRELLDTSLLFSKISPKPHVKVKQMEDSKLLKIQTLSTDPEQAALIANLLAKNLKEMDKRVKKEDYKDAAQLAHAKLETVKDQYFSILDDIEVFQEQNKSLDLGLQVENSLNKLNELVRAQEQEMITKAELQAEYNLYKNQFSDHKQVAAAAISESPQIETLKSQLSQLDTEINVLDHALQASRQNSTDYLNVPDYLVNSNPSLKSLLDRLYELQADFEASLQEKTSDHPEVKAIKEKIAKVRSQVSQEITNFRQNLQDKVNNVQQQLELEARMYQKSSQEILVMEREISSLQEKIKKRDAQIKEQLSIFSDLPGKLNTQSRLQTDYDINKEQYSSFLGLYHDLNLAEFMARSDLRIVNSARVPDADRPLSPDYVLNGIIGLFLGSLLGLGGGLLAEYLDDTVTCADELRARGLFFAGAIGRKKRGQSALITEQGIRAPLYESYRNIKHGIQNLLDAEGTRTLVVASSFPQEGRSSFATNLGYLLARDGQKVLLVDTDVRKPALHNFFAIPLQNNSGRAPSKKNNLEDSIATTHVLGLDLLPCGPISEDPGSMLESSQFWETMDHLSRSYDLLIFDSPPVHKCFDGLVLAKNADQCIFLVQNQRVSKRALDVSLELFQQYGIKPAGVILNKVKKPNIVYSKKYSF